MTPLRGGTLLSGVNLSLSGNLLHRRLAGEHEQIISRLDCWVEAPLCARRRDIRMLASDIRIHFTAELGLLLPELIEIGAGDPVSSIDSFGDEFRGVMEVLSALDPAGDGLTVLRAQLVHLRMLMRDHVARGEDFLMPYLRSGEDFTALERRYLERRQVLRDGGL